MASSNARSLTARSQLEAVRVNLCRVVDEIPETRSLLISLNYALSAPEFDGCASHLQSLVDCILQSLEMIEGEIEVVWQKSKEWKD